MEELARRSNKIDFLSCLRHSARQFIVRHGDKTEVVAGYPWFGRWGRDTFIALPGITLTQGGVESCCEVIDTMVREMKDGMFPEYGQRPTIRWTLRCGFSGRCNASKSISAADVSCGRPTASR